MNVDEIRRPREGMEYPPRAMHLGFASSKEADREKWVSTEPSSHQLDFEENNLSHFPGAVAARIEAGEKSCSDRFWICADDSSSDDGSRVIFGYVVEGLDVIKKICEASLSAQDEQAGVGKPTENITVTAVKVL
jgi:cyclophilin family peptidyl-prolyl cis-trans isomerase